MEQKSNIVLISDFGRSGQGWLSYMLCYILNAQFVEPYNFLNGNSVILEVLKTIFEWLKKNNL